MSEIFVLEDGGEWEVWIGLDGDTPAPGGCSFIISVGITRDEAVQAAVLDLEGAIDALQGPPPEEALR